MKKILVILAISFLSCSSAIGEDFVGYSVDQNIHKHDWKVDKVRSTKNTDIYYLSKNKRLLNCVVTLEDDWIDTICRAP